MSQLINFNRVEKCRRFYRNEHGHVRSQLPECPTCCNDFIPADVLDKYKARQYVDHWNLVVKLYFTMYDCAEFTGVQAAAHWSAYAAYLREKSGRRTKARV
jgi:hypothetical protein